MVDTVTRLNTTDELSIEVEAVIRDKTVLANGDTVINLQIFETPLGKMIACATEKGICMLEFMDRDSYIEELKNLKRLLNATIEIIDNKHLKALEEQLYGYFAKKRKKFELSLITPGTEFQNKVWEKLMEIPYGKSRSYKQQSIAVGNLGAIRAVGTANGANRIAIVIPCHRVIGEDGSLTGYGGGLKRKKWLLEFESGAPQLFSEEWK